MKYSEIDIILLKVGRVGGRCQRPAPRSASNSCGRYWLSWGDWGAALRCDDRLGLMLVMAFVFVLSDPGVPGTGWGFPGQGGCPQWSLGWEWGCLTDTLSLVPAG